MISVAFVAEDVNLARSYKATDCADPTDRIGENVLPVRQAKRRRVIVSRIFSPLGFSTIPIRY
jgi:hypothetical protein